MRHFCRLCEQISLLYGYQYGSVRKMVSEFILSTSLKAINTSTPQIRCAVNRQKNLHQNIRCPVRWDQTRLTQCGSHCYDKGPQLGSVGSGHTPGGQRVPPPPHEGPGGPGRQRGTRGKAGPPHGGPGDSGIGITGVS